MRASARLRKLAPRPALARPRAPWPWNWTPCGATVFLRQTASWWSPTPVAACASLTVEVPAVAAGTASALPR
eukprot:2683852-Alexandrium_andersonii.AAC.1